MYANTVYDAKLCLKVDGAGTAVAPIAIHTDLVSGSPASAEFSCGVRPSSVCNIGPDSVVDRIADTLPFTTCEWHGCP